MVVPCCSGRDRKINCFQDLYSVHIVLWCRPWKLKDLFAILTSKTTKKSLHSQYLYTLRVPDAIGWFCWPWKGELGLGKEEWLGDVTQHLVQTGRQDGFQIVGWFALGVTQFYKVIFSECSRQNAKDFFHQKVMLRTDLMCTCTILYIWPQQRTVILTVWDGIHNGTPSMNSISVSMSRKIFSRLQKSYLTKYLFNRKIWIARILIYSNLIKKSTKNFLLLHWANSDITLFYGHLLIKWLNFWRAGNRSVAALVCWRGLFSYYTTIPSPLFGNPHFKVTYLSLLFINKLQIFHLFTPSYQWQTFFSPSSFVLIRLTLWV